MVSILKALGLMVISAILCLLLTFIIGQIDPYFLNSIVSLYFWIFSSLILAIILNLIFNRGKKGDSSTGTSSPWGPPEEIRDRVVTTPQFVGRFDRSRGLLESTARMVERDRASYESMERPDEVSIIRFRGEMLDQNGSPLEFIPVEIKGSAVKWIGSIMDGDRVRVEGKVESDGILHSRKAFNFSTNSWVGERK
jgi:hypothetical protein